jgi:hypothetical protein
MNKETITLTHAQIIAIREAIEWIDNEDGLEESIAYWSDAFDAFCKQVEHVVEID